MRSLIAIPLSLLLVASAAPALAAEPVTFDGQELPSYEPGDDGLLGSIRERGVLFNGVNAANPPFEFVNEGGEIVGYDIDLATEFAEWLGVEIAIVDTAWDGVIPSLYTKKFDMIWSAMTITDLRQEAVNFSQPYASDQAVWIALAGDDSINAVEDLEGQSICTQANSAFEAHAQTIIDDAGVNAEIKSFQDFPTAYLAVENGECAVGTSSTLNNLPLNESRPDVFRNAVFFDQANYVGVATRLPDTDLAGEIATFVEEIKANGRINELQEKWFGFSMQLPDAG
jgi:polar amino acid transport system substrate-binding protein